jgi:hypothetical protein
VTTDQWQTFGIICGAILAALTLIGFVWRKVVLPVFRVIRRLNEVADQLLGDKAKRIPSMTERMSALEQGLREHMEWHSQSGRTNGPRPAPRPAERR